METGAEVRTLACCFGNVEAARKNACVTVAADRSNGLIKLPAVGRTP